jgi:hypothetical protein
VDSAVVSSSVVVDDLSSDVSSETELQSNPPGIASLYQSTMFHSAHSFADPIGVFDVDNLTEEHISSNSVVDELESDSDSAAEIDVFASARSQLSKSSIIMPNAIGNVSVMIPDDHLLTISEPALSSSLPSSAEIQPSDSDFCIFLDKSVQPLEPHGDSIDVASNPLSECSFEFLVS